MGILSAFLLLLPVVIILVCNLAGNKSLLALLFYFFITSFYYLILHRIIPLPLPIQKSIGIISNYLDVPLMCIVFMLFSTSLKKKKMLQVTLYAFVGYEIIISLILGFNRTSMIYIIGPGIVLIIVYSIIFFSQYIKLSIEKNKLFGKTVMITSILFAYVCHAMIYCFMYLKTTSAIDDVYLIHYINLIIVSIAMSIGLLLLYKRCRKIKEVLVTRKELALFFEH